MLGPAPLGGELGAAEGELGQRPMRAQLSDVFQIITVSARLHVRGNRNSSSRKPLGTHLILT